MKNFVRNIEGLNRGNPGNKGGTGRPKKEATRLKELTLEQKNCEAEKSLDFVISIRDNESESKGLRMAAAVEIMDRVWGKAPHSVKVGGEVSGRLIFQFPPSQ